MKSIDDEQNTVIHKKMPPQRQESIHTEHDDAQIAPNDSADLEFKISLDCKRFTYLAFFLAVIFPLLVSSFVPTDPDPGAGAGAGAGATCNHCVVKHISVYSLTRIFISLLFLDFLIVFWIDS